MGNSKHPGKWLTLGVLLLAQAQAQTTQVSGQVVDESHAAVTGVVITLTRMDTGDHRAPVSTDQGYYTFPSVLPGNYSVRFEKQGFDVVDRTGITVQTGQSSIVDAALPVGQVSQSVNVNAAPPLLQTDSAADRRRLLHVQQSGNQEQHCLPAAGMVLFRFRARYRTSEYTGSHVRGIYSG